MSIVYEGRVFSVEVTLDNPNSQAKPGMSGALILGSVHRPSRRLVGLARRKLQNPDGAKCVLADAQFVIARSHGFMSWPRLVKHLEGLTRTSSSVSRFEAAADAIVAGDVATLNRLLGEDPTLIHARSTREHARPKHNRLQRCSGQMRSSAP